MEAFQFCNNYYFTMHSNKNLISFGGKNMTCIRNFRLKNSCKILKNETSN